MKLEFYPQIFEKHSNIKFHENPSSGSRVAPCGIVAFRKFANAPKNRQIYTKYKLQVTTRVHNNNSCTEATRTACVLNGKLKKECHYISTEEMEIKETRKKDRKK